ncbi:MAG TPA: VWA domain-containing protein [Thermoanaerobaculia bacterium]|nr:VWA domain-containing protein [Thermoanaerobaculia bacterium]
MNVFERYTAVSLLSSLLIATTAAANTQLTLTRGVPLQHATEYTGVVDMVIVPAIENAKVTVTVDGQKVATNLLAPYRITVDLGPTPMQHRISVSATSPKGKRAQWTETINRGNLPLSVRLQQIDTHTFEAITTSPKEDPIEVVQLWENAQVVASTKEAPYRFTVPDSMLSNGYVQVTARAKSGEEAADFWAPGGDIVAEELQVRTIPIFVSVVDRNGNTRDDVDRSQFRIIDNGAEAKIIEFGKAFDQPISIALLLDASASMTYSMEHASKAAADFVEKAIKEGDRCSITAIQEVPRRKLSLSQDRTSIREAVRGIKPNGQTALYDAVISAIRELREEKNRRAIVVMTDGGDTASNYTFEDAHKMAREAGIPLYFIAYEGGSETRDLERLTFLAAETGGFIATATQQNLLARYEAIEKDLRAQFAITYVVSDLGKANQYRRVQVVMSSPKLTARTIKGYFTP